MKEEINECNKEKKYKREIKGKKNERMKIKKNSGIFHANEGKKQTSGNKRNVLMNGIGENIKE